MSAFGGLDRADDWLSTVARAFARRVAAAESVDAWNHGPEHDRTRGRAVRLLDRAYSRREREVSRLVASPPIPAAERIVRTRLRDRAEDRSRRAPGNRDPHPLGRASR